jgi:TolB-like protein/DNA-binding winged helix-turn-helix (wHTH) protein/Flp pilus assembly protein TadD
MITTQSQPKQMIAHFSAFEVNFASGELFKHGSRIKLQRQPFRILCVLVERAGEVVSREELRERLWPDNTFVEYEDSLNTAVRKLRAALSDSSDLPRYIETVARQGYRLIVPVTIHETRKPEVAGARVASQTTDVLRIPYHPDAARAERPEPSKSENKTGKFWLSLVAAFTVLVIAIAGWFAWTHFQLAQVAAARPMLAVLPFQNLTGDANQEYFSDGLTEEMIGQLGNLDPRRLGVIARTSVMRYKNTPAGLDQIARELGVQYLMEGSIRRDGNNVRITAELIQTKDQSHLWARQYDRELNGLLALQSEIGHEIADQIELTLGEHKVANGPTASPQNFDAYDLYLKGQYFFNKRTTANLEEAIGYFQQASVKDPNYARAYAGLADSYALMGGYSGHPQTEFMPKARAAALRALQIDDSLPEAHTALALIVQNYDFDWETAEKEFRRAIELNPNYATAHHWYAEHLMWRGRFDEALQESERARQLDPLSLIIAADNGAILYFSRQYDRAIEKWRSVLEMDPNFARAHLIMGAYVEKGMFAEALGDNEKFRPVNPASSYWSWRAYIYGRSGQTVEARHALLELLKWNRNHPLDAMMVAWANVAVGDKDQALAWVEKAHAQHSNELVSLKVNPGYDSLRNDPRFQGLLRNVGLAP